MGNAHRLIMPRLPQHPIAKGIEHLFEQATLTRARDHKRAFIDISDAHESTVRGVSTTVPEEWSVHPQEKTNLCNWLCENGTVDDFRHFGEIFTMLEECLSDAEDAAEATPAEVPS